LHAKVGHCQAIYLSIKAPLGAFLVCALCIWWKFQCF